MREAPNSVNTEHQRAESLKARYASLDQAASWYGVSQRTIRREIAEGKLPAVRIGRQIRIAWDDLEALATRIPTAAIG